MNSEEHVQNIDNDREANAVRSPCFAEYSNHRGTIFEARVSNSNSFGTIIEIQYDDEGYQLVLSTS